MAKYYNNRIKTGKVAGSVFAVRYGEVIERAYNPIVLNPKSSAQVESRAKLKLLSQLGAVMGSYIPIPREGAMTPRNKFIRLNYQAVSYANDQADIALSDIDITGGVIGLNNVVVTRSEDDVISAQINGNSDLSRVVFIGFVKQNDNTLRSLGSVVATQFADNSWGPVTFNSSLPVVIVAYGVRDNTENARIVFSNMQVLSAETVAKIIVSRNLLLSDVTLTETKVGTV